MTRNIATFLLCAILGSSALEAAVIYAIGTATLNRGDPTVGALPGFYGGDLFGFPLPLTDFDARFAVTGEPDGFFLSLPGRNDTATGSGFPYSYVELTFSSTFIARGTTVTLFELGPSDEQALIWWWVSGGGFIHANALVRNTSEGYAIDLSSLQTTLEAFGPGAVFTKIGIGGLDLSGESPGFDLDAVSLTTSEVPEPATFGLIGMGLVAIGVTFRPLKSKREEFF